MVRVAGSNTAKDRVRFSARNHVRISPWMKRTGGQLRPANPLSPRAKLLPRHRSTLSSAKASCGGPEPSRSRHEIGGKSGAQLFNRVLDHYYWLCELRTIYLGTRRTASIDWDSSWLSKELNLVCEIKRRKATKVSHMMSLKLNGIKRKPACVRASHQSSTKLLQTYRSWSKKSTSVKRNI